MGKTMCLLGHPLPSRTVPVDLFICVSHSCCKWINMCASSQLRKALLIGIIAPSPDMYDSNWILFAVPILL